MAPPSGQKGTAAGKKGSSAINRQRSRNTTPMGGAAPPQQSAGSGTSGGANGTGSGGATSSSSLGVNSASASFSGLGGGATGGGSSSSSIPAVESIETEFLDLKFDSMRSLSYDDLLDAVANSAAGIPDSRSLDGLITRLGKLSQIIDRRGVWCDKGMRLVASERKIHYSEMAAGGGGGGGRRSGGAGDDSKDENDAGEKKSNKKKRKASDNLAPPDSNAPERSSPLRDPGNKRKHSRAGSASSSLSPAAAGSPTAMDVDEKPKSEKKDDAEEEEESSEDEGAPPRREAPQYQTFGEDPSTFPDPTVYEIIETNSSMSVDELKEIYSVAVFPKTNLADQIAGDPPDKDFTIAKPQNQISFSTFSTYIEPYFRPFSEEDLAFLRERGDRVTPFNMPKRGKKHYSEIWREEDGGMSIDSNQGRDKLQPNQPRGSIDNMDDDVAETDKLSVGPILARLLQAMRPEGRAADDKPATNGVNGDADKDDQPNGETNGVNGEDGKSLPPASYMNESSSEAWKKATHPKLDYSQVDERIKQELRHIGFLPQEGFEGDYDGHFDDEVAGRLRLLQDRLRQQMLINGARKARLTDLVKERMAFQEYTTILEDLDSQVQGAYLKRTRTMGKSKKAKRPGGAGGGAAAANAAAGMARPGIGDVTKMLMERRKRWIESIGTVFDDENLGKVPRSENPDSSIFKPDMMGDLIKKEKQAWDEEVEEE